MEGRCQLKRSWRYLSIYHQEGLQIEIHVRGFHEVVELLVGMLYYLYLGRFFYLPYYSCFHEVLDTLLILYSSIVILPASDTPLSPRIADNLKYTPYFNDCIGALDGTHIAAYVSTTEQARYRNRKGTLSQNVLAVCNFDMQFVYVLPGWEGSAHDRRVLSDAQSYHGFNTPKGKYWLGDAGYGNSEYIMSPYRGV
jgi:hypothetical protein